MAEQAQATRQAEQPGAGGPKAPAADAAARPAQEPGLIAGLTRKQLAGLAALVVLMQLPFIVYFARGQAPVTATVPLSDDFNRTSLGDNYFSTGGHWRIRQDLHDDKLSGGVLHSPGVKNNPLWLKAKLPDDVAVEFDARSESADGDLKCEIFGNGRDHASGYIVVFGGWSNTISVIARLNEHGTDRKENHTLRVEKGKSYHFRIERKGGLLRWFLDGQLAMEFDDRAPLKGPGHDRFGFSSWDSDLYFDNLVISPL